jgi:hypothetical protein
MRLLGDIERTAREFMAMRNAPRVKVKGSEEMSEFHPKRFYSQTEDMFRAAATLSQEIGHQIVYYSILEYALTDDEFLTHGKVLRNNKGGNVLGFVPDHDFIAVDLDGEATPFLQGQIIVGYQTPNIFEAIREIYLPHEP